jgi:hypothetical protein
VRSSLLSIAGFQIPEHGDEQTHPLNSRGREAQMTPPLPCLLLTRRALCCLDSFSVTTKTYVYPEDSTIEYHKMSDGTGEPLGNLPANSICLGTRPIELRHKHTDEPIPTAAGVVSTFECH